MNRQPERSAGQQHLFESWEQSYPRISILDIPMKRSDGPTDQWMYTHFIRSYDSRCSCNNSIVFPCILNYLTFEPFHYQYWVYATTCSFLFICDCYWWLWLTSGLVHRTRIMVIWLAELGSCPGLDTWASLLTTIALLFRWNKSCRSCVLCKAQKRTKYTYR